MNQVLKIVGGIAALIPGETGQVLRLLIKGLGDYETRLAALEAGGAPAGTSTELEAAGQAAAGLLGQQYGDLLPLAEAAEKAVAALITAVRAAKAAPAGYPIGGDPEAAQK